ncbi:MAG: putative ABC transporter permease [Patescibacteria group bacterium]|nr:MAG: putative ABC transporter permease [Patescibacteria group bacterium]
MSPFAIAASFVFYSIVGWFLDTAWRTLRKHRYTKGGFSKYPFSPIYGFGALIAISLEPVLRTWALWLQWSFLSVLLGAFEYASGVMIVKTLRRRLWNYTDEPLDLEGHTTPYYALAWGALALLVIYVIQPGLETRCLDIPLCAAWLR